MFVKEIMTKDVITVSPDTSLKEAGEIIKKKRISGIPVVNKYGDILGIVTLTDLLQILNLIYNWKELEKRVTGLELSKMHEEEKLKAKVRDIMKKEVYTVREDDTIEVVMKLMFNNGVHTIPVTKEGKLVGVIGKRDLIYACF